MFSQMRQIDYAYNEYIRKNGVKPALSTPTERSDYKIEVVEQGILREFPVPDPAWGNNPGFGPDNAQGWIVYYQNVAGTAALEHAYYIYFIKDDLCSKFNEIYTDLGSDITTSWGAVEDHGGVMCSNVTASANIIYGISEVE